MLKLTDKQKEFWTGANHRWNIKEGATRTGKAKKYTLLCLKKHDAVRYYFSVFADSKLFNNTMPK